MSNELLEEQFDKVPAQTKFNRLMQWIEEHDDIVPIEFHDISEFGRFHKPVCVKCQIGMNVDMNGVAVIDTFMNPPEPYQLWSADQWVCPVCRHKIINGFSNVSIQHHQNGFENSLAIAVKGEHVFSFERIQDAIEALAAENILTHGKWVDIYQKPYTAEEFEGRAKLIERIDSTGFDPDVQRWKVVFLDQEDESYERTICTWLANVSEEP